MTAAAFAVTNPRINSVWDLYLLEEFEQKKLYSVYKALVWIFGLTVDGFWFSVRNEKVLEKEGSEYYIQVWLVLMQFFFKESKAF